MKVTLKCPSCKYEEQRERNEDESFDGLPCPNCQSGMDEIEPTQNKENVVETKTETIIVVKKRMLDQDEILAGVSLGIGMACGLCMYNPGKTKQEQLIYAGIVGTIGTLSFFAVSKFIDGSAALVARFTKKVEDKVAA